MFKDMTGLWNYYIFNLHDTLNKISNRIFTKQITHNTSPSFCSVCTDKFIY